MMIEEVQVNWIALEADGTVQAFLHEPVFNNDMKMWETDGSLSEDFYVTIDCGECEVKKVIGLYNVLGDNPYDFDEMPAKLWHYVKNMRMEM